MRIKAYPSYTKIIIIITSSQILPKYFTVIFTVKVRAYKTGLTPPLFIKVSVPIQESERSCICVLGESVLPLSTIFLLDFGNISTVWDFLFVFHLIVRSIMSSVWNTDNGQKYSNASDFPYIFHIKLRFFK